uniref:Uncharacterized protein n=1 Tax=Rhipicephalus zambeziensis TaxID=60191 RepID=A0A224Y686_9ACAR
MLLTFQVDTRIDTHIEFIETRASSSECRAASFVFLRFSLSFLLSLFIVNKAHFTRNSVRASTFSINPDFRGTGASPSNLPAKCKSADCFACREAAVFKAHLRVASEAARRRLGRAL